MIAICTEAVTDMILAEEGHLRRVARRLVRCESAADDLVQDTLLRAYRARDRFVPGTSVRAWMTTILRRVFLTAVMRDKRRRLETDTDAGEPLGRAKAPAEPLGGATPAFSALLDRVDDRVKAAIERVPELYRAPFLLSVIEELSCADIADRLGVPQGTVMSRIHRAREKLKRDLVYDRCADRAVAPARLRLLAGSPAAARRLVAV